MVRKRSRKYESDDNDSDSDLDFDFEHQSRPAAKKYSLRERKGPVLTDFDYYGLDDEEEAKKASSDDEDFQVEADANGEVARSYFEPDPEADPQNSEGLIDFEDIIRADIVVNRNKIDYDNMIQKTEIKLTESPTPTPQPPKRRGRKPKNRVDEVVTKKEEEESDAKFVCEPDIASLEQMEKLDPEEAKKEEMLELVEAKKEDCKDTDENKETVEPESSEKKQELPLQPLENGDSKLDDIEPAKDTASIEMVILEPPPPQLEDDDQKIEDEDDDVIVLGELKQDVIVLDD